MKRAKPPGLITLLLSLLALNFQVVALFGHTFPAFDAGTLTGGGAAFIKSLDVSSLPDSDYLFVRVTATHVSAPTPQDAWSDSLVMGLSDGGSVVYWITNIASSGTLDYAGTSSLVWSGMLPASLYHGGSNLTVTIVDPYTDTGGPYFSTVSNVVVSIYPAPAGKQTFASFNVGTLAGGGPLFHKSLDVSRLPNSEYLFVRVTATHVSGPSPHDGWSDSVVMSLANGGSVEYWPAEIATAGALDYAGTSQLVWSGMLPASTYIGGSNLTVTISDTYTDAGGPYYSTVSNVVVTIYPAPAPKQTFAAFDVGLLTGAGPEFTQPLDISGLPATEYFFARITATHVSADPPNDGWSDTLFLGLNDGAGVDYMTTNTATSGALDNPGTSSLVWAGMMSAANYRGGSNLVVTVVDPYTDFVGPYYSTVTNVVVTLYPGVTETSTPIAPPLTIVAIGSQMLLQWPTNFPGFVLQSTTNLASPADWARVLPDPVILNGLNTALSPLSGTRMFFRLAH